MIELRTLADINWETVQAVAYEGAELTVAPDLLARVEAGRVLFEELIAKGVPCYGVTTGLGELVTLNLTEAERLDLPHNILRARAAAIGEPLPMPVVRAMMMLRLVNFLSDGDGVSVGLVQFLVDRLNDGFTPWVPAFGHGMGADATAQTHAFQTFIGEGFVLGNAGGKMPASLALKNRNIPPLQLGMKEGLALLNGISAAPAYALHAHRQLSALLRLANMVAAVSCEGAAVPKDSFDVRLKAVSAEVGTNTIIDIFQPLLANSQIAPFKLQSAISFRVIPQVHGALWDALAGLRRCIERAMATFSDNPLMVADESEAGGRFLSVGLFHNQHLVNQADHVAVALCHAGILSTRRLHRLLSASNTGLNTQLAPRPGLDAGLVVAHKAAIGISARLKQLATPVSIYTEESSAGQEDYMSMAIPTIARLVEMAKLVEMIFAYELLGGLTALDQRGEKAGDGVVQVQDYFKNIIAPLHRDRSPGPDVEAILETFQTDSFRKLITMKT
jgi:histidine ammonia-lyase